MKRTSAYRRSQSARVRNNFRKSLLNKFYWFNNREKELEWIELRTQSFNTRKPCSCYMCGNPRKHFNEKTWPELEKWEY